MTHSAPRLIIAGIIGLFSLCQAQEWEWQNPWPTGSDLSSVVFVSASEGWMVGSCGTVLHTTDTGTTWTSSVDDASHDFRDIAIVGSDVWVAGTEGAILHTSDGGSTWIDQGGATSHNVNALAFVDTDNGWAVGDSGTILRTTDGGASWVLQPSGTAFDLYGLDFVTTTNGWAVGDTRTILHTTDGGGLWVNQLPGSVPGNYLRGVDFLDENNGRVVGGNLFGATYWSTSDGGATWTSGSPQHSGMQLYGVTFMDPDHGWAVGGLTDYENGAVIMRTTNGGTYWGGQVFNTDALRLLGLHFRDVNDGWAVGLGGTILHTTDGGQVWAAMSETTGLSAVDFVDSDQGWAVGGTDSGAILRTNDGGTSWLRQASGAAHPLWGVAFADEMNGWAIGSVGTVLNTSSGGEVWLPQIIPGWPQRELWDVYAADATHGWAVGDSGGILHTSDGSMWDLQVSGTINSLHSVDFVNGISGWCVGDQIILHTTDSGNIWTLQSLPPWPVDPWLRGVRFLDENNGWAVGGFSSGYAFHETILRTTDGGNTWSTQYTGGGDPSYLSAVDFADDSHGWAVGSEFDPDHVDVVRGLVLYTTDGGYTWLRDTEVQTRALSDITFVSATQGWTVGFGGTILHYSGPFWSAPTDAPTLPAAYSLSAYPNPFNSSTRLSYDVPRNEHVNLAVYDLNGRLVRMLEDRVIPQGRHTLTFDGSVLPSGMYFVRLKSRDFSQAQKLLLLR